MAACLQRNGLRCEGGLTDRAMRIGMYSPTYPGVAEGGIGTYTRNLAHGLTERGHEVHVLTPGLPSQSFVDGRVIVHTAAKRHMRIADRIIPGVGANLRIRNAMCRLVKLVQLDIVEFPNWEGMGIAFSALRHVPVVVRLYTSSLDSLAIDGVPVTRSRAWEIRRELWQAKLATQLVTHSHAHRAAAARHLRTAENRIAVIPLGIPIDENFVRPPRREGPLSVVYLGRLERRKGTIDLLRAIPRVVKEIPSVQFTLIGEDRPHCPNGRTHARFAAEELPGAVQQHIRFLGELPTADVDRWLQSADLFVAPSLYESFGLIFVEAMRWGTPVLGTRTGGIPEIIEDDVTGALVEPGNFWELAVRMVQLLNDEGTRTQLGEAGRRRAAECFSVEQMAAGVESLYREVLSR